MRNKGHVFIVTVCILVFCTSLPSYAKEGTEVIEVAIPEGEYLTEVIIPESEYMTEITKWEESNDSERSDRLISEAYTGEMSLYLETISENTVSQNEAVKALSETISDNAVSQNSILTGISENVARLVEAVSANNLSDTTVSMNNVENYLKEQSESLKHLEESQLITQGILLMICILCSMIMGGFLSVTFFKRLRSR